MPRRRSDEEEEEDEEEVEEEYNTDEEERGGKRSRGVESFIDDAASEDDDADDDDDDDDDYGGGGGRARGRGSKRMRSSILIDDMAQVDDDDDVDDDVSGGEPDFIDDDIRVNDVRRRPMPHPRSMVEDDQEVEEYLRGLQERSRYGTTCHSDYDAAEVTEVEQQALLPSVKDPKLWMVKCAVGHERETAICLMQKFIDRPDLQIKTVVALEHLKNFIYIEAEKESHVIEACKGLRNIIASAKITLVPIREMADVLSVESKSVDLSRESWVRTKLGVYKGDLAKVVDVDNVRQKVTVKLIPRIDLQALANKLDGKEVVKRSFVTPQRFFSVDEAREMHIRVDRRRNGDSGEYFDVVGSSMFKDGFLYKTFSMKSVSTQNIKPSLEELEKFRTPGDDLNEDVASLSTLFSNRKKGHFMKGDAVIVIKGDLKNLKGYVEKVEDGTVHIQPKLHGLPRTLAFSEKDLCKYFNPGDHVKVISGVQENTTGMVVKVEGHVLIILSDTTKEHIRVFADHVMESSEVTTGITRIGDYVLHDLVLLNLSFGIIIRVESEAFQILMGVPDRPELVLVKLREIKCKIGQRTSAKDRSNNIVSTKDVVRVVEGACKGKQGPVEHIHRGILFIYDRHYLEHSGFICAKSQSCLLVGGSTGNHRGNAMDTAYPNVCAFSYPARISQSPGRLPPRGPHMNSGGRFGGRGGGGRGHDALVNRCIKIKSGPYKGYRGRVKEVTGALVRIELDSQMKIVTVKREDIGDTAAAATPFCETCYSRSVETPVHPSQTPLHPIQTPIQDPGATPIRDGMRTPMPSRSRAWVPMSPARDNWEDGDPTTWASSPTYQPGTPQARPYEAPTPGSVWATGCGDASGNTQSTYAPSTPLVQPMTPDGQPTTPGDAGMDLMSPVIGGEAEGNWLLPDVLVNVSRGGDEITEGVVKEVLLDGSCRVALGSLGNGDELIATANELEVVRPKKNEKLKIMNGAMRGFTGKLIGVDGSDGIVRVEGNVKIVDMAILGKMAA